MATQILEGTFAEVQQQLKGLRLKPEKRVRVILEEETQEQEREKKTELYGVRLFPITDPNHRLTTEQVLELIDSMEE